VLGTVLAVQRMANSPALGKAFTDVSVERELVSSYTVVRCNWNEGRGEGHTVESTLTDLPHVSGGRSGSGVRVVRGEGLRSGG
jgi:hypothetical protein